MKKKLLTMILCTSMVMSLMVGCGSNADVADGAQNSGQGEETDNQFSALDILRDDDSAESEEGEADPVEESDESNADEWENVSMGTPIPYSSNGISLSFPEDWKDRYIVKEHESGISVYQKAGDEISEGLGFLFSVYSDECPYLDYPETDILGYTPEKMYYFARPSDVPFVDATQEEYTDMCRYINAIQKTVSIDVPNFHGNANEYVYPMSEYAKIDKEMLMNLDERYVWLARNEIFARHGYEFNNYYLQAYFERYDWYVPRGSQFSESEFSKIEKDNIDVMKAYEDECAKNTPYPMEKNVGQNISVDLDEDGTPETLLYELEEDSNGWLQGYITINGKKYSLEDDFQIGMDIAEDKHFYITDISSYDKGLEIAVADYGPSDDPMTHFFVYEPNHGLKFIGSVSGLPMKQMGFQNGFGEGYVIGYGRCMTADVHEYTITYYYNRNSKHLNPSDADGHYDLPRTHELIADLELHTEKNMNSETFVVPKGSKTFFKYCWNDGWILVHAPNGVEGYIHLVEDTSSEEWTSFKAIDGMNVNAEKVFGNLLIYD